MNQLALLDQPAAHIPPGSDTQRLARNITGNITTGVSGGPLPEMYSPPWDWSETDARLGLPGNRQLYKLAAAIDASHKQQTDKTANWRTSDHRLIGLIGERAAARWLGLPMDLRIKRHGNSRANLICERPHMVIDVITRRPLANGDMPDLTRRMNPGRITNVDALVLVVWQGDDYEPWLAGWISEIEMWQSGERQRFQTGITNLVLPIGALWPMEELWQAMHP